MIVNHDIEVRVVAILGKTVKLGFTFPPEASVLREVVESTSWLIGLPPEPRAR